MTATRRASPSPRDGTAAMSGAGPDGRLIGRLRADLSAARRQRDASGAAAIGSLLTALENARAVAVEAETWQRLAGSAEMPRRMLEPAEVEAIVHEEIAERRAALEEYRRLGADAARLETELETLERYREEP